MGKKSEYIEECENFLREKNNKIFAAANFLKGIEYAVKASRFVLVGYAQEGKC